MTAKQIRLQAQKKRREFHMNERKKWNDIELQNKEAILQEHLSELDPTPTDELEPTPTDEEADEASELFSSEADSRTYTHNTALQRQADSQQSIETQQTLRRRALDKRKMQKRLTKALGPAARSRAATDDQAEAVIDLATKNLLHKQLWMLQSMLWQQRALPLK